jgi:hypothetical protein
VVIQEGVYLAIQELKESLVCSESKVERVNQVKTSKDQSVRREVKERSRISLKDRKENVVLKDSVDLLDTKLNHYATKSLPQISSSFWTHPAA